jgi:hypothetical protein
VAQLLTQQAATPATIDADDAPDAEVHAPLPLVALVLGVAGVVLGVTVVWFFAAIPIGIVSVAIGVAARRRIDTYDDPHAASRATIGTALGCVAILLGVTGAYFLPRVMDRADRFLGSVQQDVNENVGLVNGGLSRDVNRLDRTLSRDLDRFEVQNHADLTDLENRTAATMKALEDRLHGDVDQSTVAAQRDLAALELSLRADLRALETEMHGTDATLHDTIAALDARLSRIEHELGL